jgi:hypothetical protein
MSQLTFGFLSKNKPLGHKPSFLHRRGKSECLFRRIILFNSASRSLSKILDILADEAGYSGKKNNT